MTNVCQIKYASSVLIKLVQWAHSRTWWVQTSGWINKRQSCTHKHSYFISSLTNQNADLGDKWAWSSLKARDMFVPMTCSDWLIADKGRCEWDRSGREWVAKGRQNELFLLMMHPQGVEAEFERMKERELGVRSTRTSKRRRKKKRTRRKKMFSSVLSH